MPADEERDGASMIKKMVASTLNMLPKKPTLIDPTSRASHHGTNHWDYDEVGIKMNECEIGHLQFSETLQPPEKILMQMNWNLIDDPCLSPCYLGSPGGLTTTCSAQYAFIQRMIWKQTGAQSVGLGATSTSPSSRHDRDVELLYGRRFYCFMLHESIASTLCSQWQAFPFAHSGRRLLRTLPDGLKQTFRQVCNVVLFTTVLLY